MTGELTHSKADTRSTAAAARWLFWVAIGVGLLIRLAILVNTELLPPHIVDEQHYLQIANNIAAGNGFGWGPGDLTSIRPPLYPGLLALMWQTLGGENLQAVRILQIALALATTGLLFVLGARLYSEQVGWIAAAAFWLYPSFIFFNFLILTETLFTFLLVAFVVLAVELLRKPRASVALLCGAALALSALTRSVLWPLPLVLCPVLAWLLSGTPLRRIALPALVLLGYAVVVAPWAIRNTRIQGVLTIVDTMGGINLRMGNYEYTPDDRMWDAVSLRAEQNWFRGYTPAYPGEPVTEGRKDKWAQKMAIAYMREHPAVTIRRSLIKFADLWGLEREFIAGVQKGLFRPPMWFSALASVAILAGYVLIVIAGAAGLWLAPPRDWRLQLLVLLPIAAIVAGHTLAFGHSRYHLPLIPFLGMYAAALIATVPLPAIRPIPRATWFGAMATVTALVAIWVRQVALVDLARITALLNHVG